MAELAGAGWFAVPWPRSSLRGGKQQRHGPGRTPWLGEGQNPWGLPRAEGWAQLSSSQQLGPPAPQQPGGAPTTASAVLGASWLYVTPLPCATSSLGSCLRVLEMLKLVEIFWLSTYVFWFEHEHWAVHSCCWNRAWQRGSRTNQKTLPQHCLVFSFHLHVELVRFGRYWLFWPAARKWSVIKITEPWLLCFADFAIASANLAGNSKATG